MSDLINISFGDAALTALLGYLVVFFGLVLLMVVVIIMRRRLPLLPSLPHRLPKLLPLPALPAS